ncbi:MAG: polysaccharide biosynthesis tyrosine autokinase [Coleofasciculus sp. C1-SOL-03]|uniref:GumC family protein n=1 Tax=Coleofasciculus sp. C1-SOL-03 TaxID=3069522 RepID=UPI0033054F8E
MEPPQANEYVEEIDFEKYWLVLKRRWLWVAGVFGVMVTLALFSISRQVPVYKAQGTLLIKEDRSDLLTGLNTKVGEIESIYKDNNPLSTQAQIIKSRPIAEKVIEELDLKNEEGEPFKPKVITGGLKVEPVPETDILQISYQSKDPKLASAVVNKVLDVYIANDVLTNRAKTQAASAFIREQLPKVEANVAQADLALRRFKEEHRVVDLTQEAIRTVELTAQLDNQIAGIQAQLAKVTARSQALRNQLNMSAEEAVAINSLNQSPAVQQVLSQLQTIQEELVLERRRFLDTDPTIVRLQEKEAALNGLLQERITEIIGTQQQVSTGDLQLGGLRQNLIANLVESEVERLGLANQLTVLKSTQYTYKQRSNNLPKLEQIQRELERRVMAAQSTYELLLQKLQETRVAENQNVGNARIISTAAVPESPNASKKKLILAGGGVAGLMLGVALAFMIDLIDQSVKTVKEAKQLFGYTLLGVIPTVDKSRKRWLPFKEAAPTEAKLVVQDKPHSPITQAYQMLRANLKFLSSDQPIKAIVVTSSVPQEGKTKVCGNLATAMAQVGQRVLLVDADMRYPSQHQFWDLTNSVGLSNVLVGEIPVQMAVETVMPGLDVLTAGVIPPNPVAILDSKRMAALMEQFSQEYDAVIVDTPPLAGIADAPILGSMADGILLVVRPGVVDAGNAKAAKEFLARSGQQVLGFVANQVMVKNEPDSYFYYTRELHKEQDDGKKADVSLEARKR